MEAFGGLIIFLMIFILGFAVGESYSNVTKKTKKFMNLNQQRIQFMKCT